MRHPFDVVVDEGCAQLQPLIDAGCERLRATRLDLSREIASGRSSWLADVAVIIVGKRAANGSPSVDLVQRIRERVPHVSIYICAQRADGALRQVKEYAVAGAGRLFELDVVADCRALAAILKARVAAPAPERLLREMVSRAEASEGRAIALECILEGFRVRHVKDMERRYAADHKTLNDRLSAAGFQTLGRLIREGRLAHAEELEHQGGMTKELVARRLCWASAKALPRPLSPAIVLHWPDRVVMNGELPTSDGAGWPPHFLSFAKEDLLVMSPLVRIAVSFERRNSNRYCSISRSPATGDSGRSIGCGIASAVGRAKH